MPAVRASRPLARREAGGQRRPVEVPADEDEPAEARFLRPPFTLEIRFHQHVNAVKDQSPLLAAQIEDALGAQDVPSAAGHELLEPVRELEAVQRGVRAE